MTFVTLIRHGESTGNVQHKWQGITDAPLTGRGVQQAQAVGERLKNRQFTVVISSPLKRAFDTAQAIHNHQPVKPKFFTDARLMEVHMGEFEDKNWNTYKLPKVDGVPYRHRRFPHGESRHDAFLRVNTFIEDLFTEYPVNDTSDVNILIVAHGMVLSEVSNVIHSKQKVPWEHIRWHNTAVTTLQLHPTGGLNVLEANDTSHLERLVRQRGGIGSASHDPTQTKLTGYFGKTA